MKITCVCPTANRPHLLVKCIKCFIAQDWLDKELIILDDGLEPFKEAGHLPDNINYIYRGPKRRSIGAKTNALIDECLSDIICKWDDDDWYAPNRLSDQFKLMEAGSKFVGYHTILFLDERYNTVYRFYDGKRTACGTSFMFHSSVWCESKFDELCVTGSDNRFLDVHQSKLTTSDGSQIVVARLHKQGSNIEAKTQHYFKTHWQYTLVPNSAIPPEFWVNQLGTKMDAIV